MTAPTRSHIVQDITTVRHLLSSFGRNNTNPPSLGQLREFIEACDGLPDDTIVSIEKGSLSEGGRFTYLFSVRIVAEHATSDPPANVAPDDPAQRDLRPAPLDDGRST